MDTVVPAWPWGRPLHGSTQLPHQQSHLGPVPHPSLSVHSSTVNCNRHACLQGLGGGPGPPAAAQVHCLGSVGHCVSVHGSPTGVSYGTDTPALSRRPAWTLLGVCPVMTGGAGLAQHRESCTWERLEASDVSRPPAVGKQGLGSLAPAACLCDLLRWLMTQGMRGSVWPIHWTRAGASQTQPPWPTAFALNRRAGGCPCSSVVSSRAGWVGGRGGMWPLG